MEDKEAIERCKKGETDCFRFLVERYQRQAVGHAAAILGSPEDAKDAVQEAFVDAYRTLSRFDTGRRFYPWFYVLIRNRCFKALAARKPAENLDAVVILASQPGIGPDEKIGLERALRELSPEEREIITLKYLDGLTYNELAEYLGIPKGTVMSRLFYARRGLQGQLIGKQGGGI